MCTLTDIQLCYATYTVRLSFCYKLHVPSVSNSVRSLNPLKHEIYLEYITLFNTQNVMETRLAELYYLEATEFENDTEIFSLALVFELQLWPEISLFFQIYLNLRLQKLATP